jgi:hypothetical protein
MRPSAKKALVSSLGYLRPNEPNRIGPKPFMLENRRNRCQVACEFTHGIRENTTAAEPSAVPDK